MSEHYYTQSPQSEHAERQVTVSCLDVELTCTTDAGTFSRDGLDFGTRVLLEAAPPMTGRVLDLGCGWGALGLTLAKKYPQAQFVLTDINERAAALSDKNRRKNGIQNASVVSGDGFAAVEGQFDCICTNPPIRAGKQVIYALFAKAKDFLLPGGSLLLVIRKQQGAKSAIDYLKTLYPTVDVLDRSGGFWVIRAMKASETSPSLD